MEISLTPDIESALTEQARQREAGTRNQSRPARRNREEMTSASEKRPVRKYLEEIDYKTPEFGDLYDELPL